MKNSILFLFLISLVGCGKSALDQKTAYESYSPATKSCSQNCSDAKQPCFEKKMDTFLGSLSNGLKPGERASMIDRASMQAGAACSAEYDSCMALCK